MARKAKYDWGRTSSSKYQKFETRLTFYNDWTHDSQESAYIDLSQCLSLINRKLVRQGHVFKVSGMKAWSNDANADETDLSVSVLPRTWMMFNAYKKARSLWNQMNLQAIDALGSGNLPKYYDFKVFYDMEHFDNHHNSDGGALTTNLLPVDQDTDSISGGDWVYSKFESNAAADGSRGSLEWNCHMLGGHAEADGTIEGSSGRDLPADGGSVGLILAYQQSRGAAFTDQDQAGLDQQVDADSPWGSLFGGDPQTQQILADLDADNDGPPYPADYAGGIEHPEGTLVGINYIGGGGDNSAGRISTYPSFEAPLGLIKLDANRAQPSGSASGNDVDGVFITLNAEIIAPC